jgi:hypothetical protein
MDFSIKDPFDRVGKYLEDLTTYEVVKEPFYEFTCSATKVDKKDFFGKSDPFFTISKTTDSDSILVLKSKIKKYTLNPSWIPVKIDLKKLCNSDEDRKLIIEVWDWNRFNSPDFIGRFQTSLKEIKKTKSFELENDDLKKKKKNYVNSGVFHFDKVELKYNPIYEITPEYEAVKKEFEKIVVSHIYNADKMSKLFDQKKFNVMVKKIFLNYMIASLEISLIVAIDFTGSNGTPSNSHSLHYLCSRDNQYQKAIKAVGAIVAPYDHDQSFPVFGFGGEFQGSTSHCFPLSGNLNTVEAKGIEGILKVYSEGVKRYPLSGPTNFSSIIQESVSRSSESKKKYNILMIITDGEISDMQNTIAEIVKSSHVGLSIIIVGVGFSNFKSMEILDADDSPLKYGNTLSVRDNVQFVPFVEYVDDPDKLAEVTLAELPRQIVEYFAIQNVGNKPYF